AGHEEGGIAAARVEAAAARAAGRAAGEAERLAGPAAEVLAVALLLAVYRVVAARGAGAWIEMALRAARGAAREGQRAAGGAAARVPVTLLARIHAAVAAQRVEGDRGVGVVGRRRTQAGHPVVPVHAGALGALERAIVRPRAQGRAERPVGASELAVGQAVD